jgi:hypothetical protein
LHGLYTIGKQEGIGRRGICKGIEASALREATYSTMRIGLYEPFKRILGADDVNAAGWKKFASGALAGMCGSAFAMPADIVKTRM